ncbi:MAG: hypothetical protein AB4352_16115 [Hormoscilla sp.]
MFVTFGEQVVEIKSWKSKSELMCCLSQWDLGSILLGEDADSEQKFYSALVHFQWLGIHYFGVGICSEDYGLSPHLLLLPESDILLLGFNRELSGVSIKKRKIDFRIELYYLFSCFWQVKDCGLILCFHEIGVVAIGVDGRERWRYSQDIVEDAVVAGDKLQIKFMDESSVCLDIFSGAKAELADRRG